MVKIVENDYFDKFVVFSVLLNSAALCIVWVGITQQANNIADFI